VFEGVKLQNKIDLQTQINLFFSLKKLNIDTSPRQSQGGHGSVVYSSGYSTVPWQCHGAL